MSVDVILDNKIFLKKKIRRKLKVRMRLTTVGRVLARASSFRSISLCHNLRMSNEVDLAKLAGEAQKVFSIPKIDMEVDLLAMRGK